MLQPYPPPTNPAPPAEVPASVSFESAALDSTSLILKSLSKKNWNNYWRNNSSVEQRKLKFRIQAKVWETPSGCIRCSHGPEPLSPALLTAQPFLEALLTGDPSRADFHSGPPGLSYAFKALCFWGSLNLRVIEMISGIHSDAEKDNYLFSGEDNIIESFTSHFFSPFVSILGRNGP